VWHAWFRKSRADLRNRRLQVAVLFVMLAAGSAVITLACTVDRSNKAVFDRVFDEANSAHIWFTSEDPADFEAIVTSPDVEQTSSPWLVLHGDLRDQGELHPAWIWGVDEAPNVSPALLKEGHWPKAARDDEVVIGVGLAHTAGLDLGDAVNLVAPNGNLGSYKVVGVAIPTFRAPYPEWTPAAVFVSPSSAEALAFTNPSALGEDERNELGAGYVLGVRLVDPNSAYTAFSGSEPARVMTRSPFAKAGVVGETEAPVVLLRVFAIFAVIASAFIAAATVTNHVSDQSRDIGLLKTIGLTPIQMAVLLIAQLLAISIPAAAFGVAVGVIATPLFLWNITDLLHTSAARSVDFATLVFVVIAVQALVVICTTLPALRAGRMSIVRAIRTGPRGQAIGASHLGGAASRLRLPPLVVVGIKDTFSRPMRSWLTLAAIITAAATLMMAFSFRVSLQRLLDSPGLIGSDPYELQVWQSGEEVPINEAAAASGEPLFGAETERFLSDNGQVASYATDLQLTTRVGEVRFLSHAMGEGVEDLGFALTDGRLFNAPNELVVGLGLANDFNVNVGDQLEVEPLPGRTTMMTVVGIYVVEDNGGQVVMFGLDTLQALEPDIDPGSYAVKLVDGADSSAVLKELVAASDGRLSARDLTFETAANTKDERQLLLPMTLLSIGLATLAAANLLSSLVFTVRERTAEFGVLKTIGFTPGQVTASVIAGVAPLALLGTLVGAPLGYFLLDFIIRSEADEEIPKDLVVLPGAGWIVLLLLIALAMTLAGSLAPANRAGRVPPSEALRSE
jgi:putative ABC transport system permease protein